MAAETQHCGQWMPKNAAQVRARQLWGNIVYTQDSDLVAVLMHNGFYNHSLQQPPASMAEVHAFLALFGAVASVTPCAASSRMPAWSISCCCCFP